MHEANRMKRLPLYLFTIIDELKAKAKAGGVDVIDLGMGNPDLPSPPHVVEALCRSARRVENQRYSRPHGEVEEQFKEAIAHWYHQRFGVTLDPKTEVLPLIGSKEGIAHLALAFLNNDDIGLVPNPAYPVHENGVIMAGGVLYNVPIGPENHFRPNFKALSREVIRMAKILFVSYPHNPTTACVALDFYKELVDWGRGKELILCSDLAYSDFVFRGKRASSILEVKEAMKHCVEFHTFSKSYSMAGWRIGFAVGNRDILASLAKTKSYCDFGIFRAVQYAATKTLLGPQGYVKKIVEIYRHRVDQLVDGLNRIGWPTKKPDATFYSWTRIPIQFDEHTSMAFTELLLRETGVAVAPGTGFGEYGEGYVRFALVVTEERIKEALQRIQRFLGNGSSKKLNQKLKGKIKSGRG